MISNDLEHSLANFFCNRPDDKILDFVGHIVPVATTQLCCSSVIHTTT